MQYWKQLLDVCYVYGYVRPFVVYYVFEFSPGLKTRTCNVLYYIAENLASNEYKHSMLRDHMYWQNCKYTGKKNHTKTVIINK